MYFYLIRHREELEREREGQIKEQKLIFHGAQLLSEINQ